MSAAQLRGRFFSVAWLFLVMLHQACAGEVNVAVAANFTAPAKKIAELFQQETGHAVKLSFGSSGNFYAQIQQGAPFDVFLSADEVFPRKLEEEGLAVSGTAFVYALGKLVLWSATPGLVDMQGKVLEESLYHKLAYADPKLAPYGLAAQQAMQKLELWDKVQPKLVTAQNITQSYQYAASGNTELAFVALSQVVVNGEVTEGSYWLVPEELYSPIKQGAVLLSAAKNQAVAQALLDYLKGTKAKAVMRSYGYGLPDHP